MSLISMLWEAITGDPPKPFVSREMMEVAREHSALMIERDFYKAELLRMGYTAKSLDARHKFYALQFKAEVIGRKAS